MPSPLPVAFSSTSIGSSPAAPLPDCGVTLGGSGEGAMHASDEALYALLAPQAAVRADVHDDE